MANTIAKLNNQIRKHGIECVKGNGYFWFAEVGNVMLPGPCPSSVYTNRFSDLTLEQWLAHVKDWWK